MATSQSKVQSCPCGWRLISLVSEIWGVGVFLLTTSSGKQGFANSKVTEVYISLGFVFFGLR